MTISLHSIIVMRLRLLNTITTFNEIESATGHLRPRQHTHASCLRIAFEFLLISFSAIRSQRLSCITNRIIIYFWYFSEPPPRNTPFAVTHADTPDRQKVRQPTVAADSWWPAEGWPAITHYCHITAIDSWYIFIEISRLMPPLIAVAAAAAL